MTEIIEIDDFDSSLSYSYKDSKLPRKIKLRKMSYDTILTGFFKFLKNREVKPMSVEATSPIREEKASRVEDIVVERLTPNSEKLNGVINLLDISAKSLGTKMASKALKIKEKMKFGMEQNLASARKMTEKIDAATHEPETTELEQEKQKVSMNGSTVARIEKYTVPEEVEENQTEQVINPTISQVEEDTTSVAPIYVPDEITASTPVIEEQKEDTPEPIVMPTMIEEEVARKVEDATPQQGYVSFKMESPDIEQLIKECARKKEESESIAEEKRRAEQAAIDAEKACLRAKQEWQDKYRAVEEQTRLLDEKNKKERAEIDALNKQKDKYQDSTQAFVTSIDALNEMLNDTTQQKVESDTIIRGKAA